MRIFEPQAPSGDFAADVEHVIERALHTTDGCPRHVVVEMILHRLGGAGYAMARTVDLPSHRATDDFVGSVLGAELRDDGKLVMRTSVRPEGVPFDLPVSPAPALITATFGRIVFIAQVHGREIQRWIRSGAPVHCYRKGLPVFDMEALAAWLDQVEGTLDEKRRVGRGRPRIGDLTGPRRRLTAAVKRFRDQETKLLREGQAKAKAVEAAAMLEGAAAEIGWSGIEALTGLRANPRYARERS